MNGQKWFLPGAPEPRECGTQRRHGEESKRPKQRKENHKPKKKENDTHENKFNENQS